MFGVSNSGEEESQVPPEKPGAAEDLWAHMARACVRKRTCVRGGPGPTREARETFAAGGRLPQGRKDKGPADERNPWPADGGVGREAPVGPKGVRVSWEAGPCHFFLA